MARRRHARSVTPQVFARQLNKSLVLGPFSSRVPTSVDHGTWPCGPNAEKGISTKANVTWRGTAFPPQCLDFFRTEGQQFRTNMFLATFFDIDVAEHFMQMVRLPAQIHAPSSDHHPVTAPCHLPSQQFSKKPSDGRALWEFQFEEKNCCHVNFIGDDSAVQDEKEFLVRRPRPRRTPPVPCLTVCVRDAPS